MTTKLRSPDQTAISISMRQRLLAEIDARAEALGLNRSQYFATLARNDIATGGNLVLHDASNPLPPTTPHTGKPVSYKNKPRRKAGAENAPSTVTASSVGSLSPSNSKPRRTP